MKRLMNFLGFVFVFGSSMAATMPEWAVGSFKGQVMNWCNDSSFSVNGEAALNVASDGKVSGNIDFSDGAKGKSTGKFKVLGVSDGEVVITAGFKWYDELGSADGSSLSTITIRRTSSEVFMEFEDNDGDEDDWEDSCPVAGTLTRVGSCSEIPSEWQKKRTLKGVVLRALPSPHDVSGVIELKCGKVNRKGIAKVSAKLIGLNGKKTSYEAQAVEVTGKLVTVNFDGLKITIEGESFKGSEGLYGGLSVESADVGGNWTGSSATATVDAADMSMFADHVLTEFLPTGEKATVKGGKWTFAKAAKVKWAKKRAETPLIYVEESGKGLFVDETNGRTNHSGLKLTYVPKKGTFKGSFKVYALTGSGEAMKLKKYNVKVSGVVVDGIGYGTASCKKPAVNWSVSVK